MLRTPSMHDLKGEMALRRDSLGRSFEKVVFVQLRSICLSTSNPTVSCARIRDIPAASRLPALLRSRRPPPELRPCRQGARRHPARRRPPYPHAGEPSRRRAVRAKAPRRVPQPPRSRVLRRGPAHPPRHPRDHRAPRRPQALPRPLGPVLRPSRRSAPPCLRRADMR